MKWYFACNDKSTDFFPQIKAAVNSALKNTTLKPNFIYDGQENELTTWLREKGVNIVKYKASFYDALKNHYDETGLKTASGAFLRCDIPIIEQEDDFVLYTDCDVLFLKDPQIDLKPEYFACSTQFDKKNYTDFNTGVMLMNVKKLKQSHDDFCEFIKKNLNSMSTYDQSAYQIFYSGKNTKLSTIFNHKPYWGVDENTVILHFHGPKPTFFENEEILKNLCYINYKLYNQNKTAYKYYLDLFKEYLPEVQYDKEAIEKLNSGIYPLTKPKRRNIAARAKDRFAKFYLKLLKKIN